MQEHFEWDECHDEDFHKFDLLLVGSENGQRTTVYMGCVMREAFVCEDDIEYRTIEPSEETCTWKAVGRLGTRSNLPYKNQDLATAKQILLNSANWAIDFIVETTRGPKVQQAYDDAAKAPR